MQSTDSSSDGSRYILQVYVGALSMHYEALSVEASKQTTAEEIVSCIVDRLRLPGTNYELAEVAGECKERRLSATEKPVSVMLLWPKHSDKDFHRFYLREPQTDVPWLDNYGLDAQILRDFIPFLFQPENREYPDLCQLPDLNESTLLENLRQRFDAGHIYTYVGSILIAVNPFKFHPIYNPKYVRLYQYQRIGPILPPHIFAIADNAYYCMLKEKRNQCVVISGESGSGKTESTNFLLHHLTALSQKGCHGSGVEQTILSAGPVLEAFGNAKTAHNNNSSRFGKFIQVNYRENGLVQGAVVQKYLLEKSRIVSQGAYERNYHVFYYLLSGATEAEREALHLLPAEKYNYLNAKNLTLENCDENYEFSRLKQSMEMVGFSAEKQRRLFNVLSAVLLLGNVEFFPKKSTYHHDESVQVRNPDTVQVISELLRVKQDTLMAALTSKRVKASGETLIMQYKLPEAIAARDALAKCLYGALFDWIVLQVNHALLNKDHSMPPHTGQSIGVLDIFGFEDFGFQNAFEQFCINYANEHLQYYFNLHVFKYEQTEYKKECIKWRDIEFMDNSGCLQLFESKPTGLLCILDDLCNFPGATNETLLQKFNTVHKDNPFFEKPQKKEYAFIIKHYAGKVKYQVAEMREKNLDLMRQDIVSVLKNSSMAFVRELVGADPVAVFRWAILRAFFRGYFAFRTAGAKHRKDRADQALTKVVSKTRFRSQNDLLISHLVTVSAVNLTINRIAKNKSFRPRERPKKGLKNLQTVKSLTAGQNLSNQTSAVKTRKQPLTVTAQFQNSLSALMDTLNQANPFFIRCIKSNPHKIPNKFDDPTVTRQLRYTGMLETVRIRRAGYNVRLTYEEFIQIYRILLPKGLVSSQKDVRDFMNTMDLNKQHYQLGLTKIYMRESQKIRLDIKLHQKIIDSIVMIQRWFRSILQRRKFVTLRTAAVTVQSFWRMCAAQKLVSQLRQERAIVLIQATWRMFLVRRWFVKLRSGIVVAQAHIRGKLARVRFKRACKQRLMKERAKLKQTQSLPVNERSVDYPVEVQEMYMNRTFGKHPMHYSLDIDMDSVPPGHYLYPATVVVNRSGDHSPPLITPANASGLGIMGPDQQGSRRRGEEVMNKAENQFRSLMISPGNSSITNNTDYEKALFNNNSNSGVVGGGRVCDDYHDYQNLKYSPKTHQHPDEDSVDKVTRQAYDLVKANKIYNDDYDNRIEPNKTPVRRVDSGPSPVRRGSGSITSVYYDGNSSRGSNVSIGSPQLSSEVEVVLVNSGIADSQQLVMDKRSQVGQHRPMSVNPQSQNNLKFGRRELCHSVGEGYQLSYGHGNSPSNVTYSGSTKTNLPSVSQHQVSMVPGSPQYMHQQSQKAKLSEELMINAAYTTTPKGKAAALLGTISEDKAKSGVLKDDGHHHNHSKISSRRVKSNFSDELPDSTSHSHHHHLNSLLSRRSAADSLKRRNSDPSANNKIPLLEVNRGNDMYQSSTHINIAGHRFRKATRIGRAEKCASCQESDAFVNEGHRCFDCKVLVHTKCIQNGGVKTLQCEAKRSKRRKAGGTGQGGALGGGLGAGNDKTPNSKYSGTREYTDSTDKIISDAKELQLMQDFITQKICKMESDCGKPSEVDRVFKQALREFKDNLVAHYSVANKQNSEILNIKYRDLIANFEQVMETCCGSKKDDFPLTMGVNAFRGFMNEFMSSRETEKPKAKRKKDKKRKIEEHTSFNGHIFQLTIINIPTACEICQLFLLWPIERGLVCQNCRLTCHKKCYQKAVTCNKIAGATTNVSPHAPIVDSKLFGCTLEALCAADGGVKIPMQIEQLITKIEMHGLYSEGIYRKSGVNSKIKELKAKMSESPQSMEIDYESYNVHVLTNVLKSFLREMPEPLLTFDRYDDFLRAADLSATNDRVQTLLSLIKKIPLTHHALLERLIFHLALVAQREQFNRMSASSLAIVFAPCVLRTNRIVPAQDSLNDISRQTKCIETLITQKMMNVKDTLEEIDTLDTAAHTASTRLSTLRSSSKVFTPEELAPRQGNMYSDAEEILLEDHIQEIKKEKALLTSTLPSLARASSDDDLLSTDLDGEGGSLDDLSSGRGDRDTYSMSDVRDMKDSVDSALCHMADSISTSAGLNDASVDSPVGVSYSIRDQNIDFIHSPRSHQLSLDREAFLKSASSGYSPAKQLTTTQSLGGSSGVGGSNNSSTNNRAVGDNTKGQSQQNLSHSQARESSSEVSGGGGQERGSGRTHASDLQRQKPIVMRSISSGYDPVQATHHHHHHKSLVSVGGVSVNNSSSSGGNSVMQIDNQNVNIIGGNINNNNNNNNNNSNNNNPRGNSRKPKRQDSLDDEPIMV